MMDRLYKILGLKKTASEAEVRSAYLRKAKQTHPDAGGDVSEFREVALAYDVLGDPVKRISYDETGLEDGAPKQEEAAVNILRNLVEMVIGDNHDPAHTDFAKEMRGQLVQGVINANKQVMDLTKKIIRCKSLSKRFTAKSGNNLIVRMLEGRISEMERQIAVIENERDNIEAAQALLETYEYTVDPKPHPQPYVGLYSANSAMNAMGFTQ